MGRAAVALMLMASAVTVRGDEAGAATMADAADGGRSCAQTGDDRACVDAPNATGEEAWRDYGFDELFEDHFNCGDILYGYENVGYFAAGGDRVEKSDGAPPSDGAEDDPVSEVQLRTLRRQWADLRTAYARGENLARLDLGAEAEAPAAAPSKGGAFRRARRAVAQGAKALRRHISGAVGRRSAVHDNGHGGVSAMVVPCRAGDAGPGKGRGVFATAPIPRGALVVDLDNGSAGFFKEGQAWREFAVSLPADTACNFIEWSWVQTIPPAHDADADPRNGLTIFVAFDLSNLMNNADWDVADANVRCGPPAPREGDGRGPCRFRYYAARDIAAGEELLMSYGEFEDVNQQGWTDMGL